MSSLEFNLRNIAGQRVADVFDQARDRSQALINQSREIIDSALGDYGLDRADYCFAAVGSVGRLEALACSDLDLIPIACSRTSLEEYEPHDKKLRDLLTEKLGGVKVSAGAELTKAACLEDLQDPATIGSKQDDSFSLTKRILIITESQAVGGKVDLKGIRREVLQAYADAERTRGRHVQSLCNDIARYYRTLCIEYKSKVDNENKDWCTRNLKLRHSRKFWYFANIVCLAALAEKVPTGNEGYVEELLSTLDLPPLRRLIVATDGRCAVATSMLLERFAFFLEFMSSPEHRLALEAVSHDKRHNIELSNPFPMLKLNSDLMHEAMIAIIESVSLDVRRRVIDWFLL